VQIQQLFLQVLEMLVLVQLVLALSLELPQQ
jgi:hypothetical protein